MSKCLVETIDCTMLKLRKNIAVPQMSIWKQNKALGTYCVSAYICRTKQWSFFFWYYYILHGIEKTIYYGSKRATTKERELTCLLKMTFYILEFQRFLKKHYHERAIFYYQENINQRTGSFPTLILGVLAFSRVANVVMVHNNLLTRWRSI